LSQLERLADDPGAVRYPLQFADGWSMSLEHAQDLRQVVRLLVLRARWQVYHGDSQGALEGLVQVKRASDTLAAEPIMVSQLVRLALIGMMVNETLELEPHAAWNDEQLARLQRELLAGDELNDALPFCHRCERVLGNHGFDNPESINMELPPAF